MQQLADLFLERLTLSIGATEVTIVAWTADFFIVAPRCILLHSHWSIRPPPEANQER
jgi:hypothetical protein